MIEVLKLALEAFEAIPEEIEGWIPDKCTDAVIAINQAIAELKSQEPVAYINVEKRILEWAKLTSWETPTVVNLPKIPLYTHPPQRTWVGLTDEDKHKTWYEMQNIMGWYSFQEIANAIEAKLKDRNI